MQFRKAKPEHLQKIKEIAEKAMKRCREYNIGQPFPKIDSIENTIIYWNMVNWKISGFYAYQVLPGEVAGEDILHITCLCVKPDSQNFGYGKKLLAHAVLTAYKEHCTYVRVSITPDNKPAGRILQKNGFEIVERTNTQDSKQPYLLIFERKVEETVTNLAKLQFQKKS